MVRSEKVNAHSTSSLDLVESSPESGGLEVPSSRNGTLSLELYLLKPLGAGITTPLLRRFSV